MKVSAPKDRPTTQRFIQIEDVIDNIIILPGGSAIQIIEVIATNFSLQSPEEQQIKILSYASLLNSLSFPVQIVIISRKLDISSYLKLLDDESKKTSNSKISEHITHYKEFVSDLVKNNTVLDKKFYIAITFSYLEKGAGNIGYARDKHGFVLDAKNTLRGKSQSISQQLARIGLKSEILEKNELIRLFYEIYNQDAADVNFVESFDPTFVQGKQTK